MTTLDIERIELREFTEGVMADAARSLGLLRKIESTLTWLERLTGQLRTDAVFAEKANEGLSSVDGVIDADGSLQGVLERAQKGVEELYNLLIQKRQSGRNDHRLTEDDGIEDAYSEAIAQAADLHNALNSLRWNIGEHDLDASGQAVSAKEFTSVDALFDHLLDS